MTHAHSDLWIDAVKTERFDLAQPLQAYFWFRSCAFFDQNLDLQDTGGDQGNSWSPCKAGVHAV